MQFAVENLHVSYVFVVGHTQCGGVAAALRDAHPPEAEKPKHARNAALGDWPIPPKTPLIGGHEGVGIIVAIGMCSLSV